MLFEIGAWTLTKILIKATKNLSKDMVQKRFKLDNKQMELLYACVDDPVKIGEFLSTLYGNSGKIKEIESEIRSYNNELSENDKTKLLTPNKKLDIYQDILEEIFFISKIRKEPLILEGFFNGENIISYFLIEHDTFNINKHDDYLSFESLRIYLEFIPDQEKRSLRIKSERERIKYSNYKNLSVNDWNAYRVSKVYNTFIEIEVLNIDLRNKIEELISLGNLFIKEDYNGIILLRKSLAEYIQSILDDLNNLYNVT